MFGSGITRKIVRLRTARTLRRFVHSHNTAVPFALPPQPQPLTPLDQSPHPSPSSSSTSLRTKFPLYRPPPTHPSHSALHQIPLTQATLDSLPSDQSLSKELKTRLTKRVAEHLPDLDEKALKAFYKNLVKSGLKDESDERLRLGGPEERRRLPLSKEEREEVLGGLQARLKGLDETLGLSSPYEDRARAEGAEGAEGGEKSVDVPRSLPRHHQLLTTLAAIAVPDQGPSQTSKARGAASNLASLEVPLGLVGQREWDALFEDFLDRGDARGAETLIDVMRLHGAFINEERVTEIMRVDAGKGNVDQVSRMIMELAQSGLPVLSEQQDLVVLSLLRQAPSRPQNAISHLMANEEAGHPYPESAYRLVISHLVEPSSLTQPNAQTRALAFDLFTHMRLAAHPTPSRETYTTMIRACGESAQPQPERARDLWIEMTESEKIEPTRDEYGAIIRALGSTKKDYLEAFDLMRQMLAKHHDATFLPFVEEAEEQKPGFSEYVPTLETFTALLEGTKRAGDLNRARWVLTEVVKLARTGQILRSDDWQKGADEELLAGVYMTYASWKPVVGRRSLKMVENKVDPTAEREERKSGEVEAVEAQDRIKQDGWLDVNVLEELVEPSTATATAESTSALQDPAASHDSDISTTPQSSADALREASALFQRILHDVELAQAGRADLNTSFKDVRLTTRLINSYISVHLAHSPSLAKTKEAYERTWASVAELGLDSKTSPNGWTYLQILEKCSLGTRGGVGEGDRAIALAWGEEAWKAYGAWYSPAERELNNISEPSTQNRRKWLAGLGPRQIERTWSAAIRHQALHGSSSSALSLLEQFHRAYPPSAIVDTYRPLPEVGFKIHLIPRAEISETDVPPHLLFSDVGVLHQRLVREERWKDVDKVKWVCKGYQGALERRRKWRMQGIGQSREKRRTGTSTSTMMLGSLGGKTQKLKRLEGRGGDRDLLGGWVDGT